MITPIRNLGRYGMILDIPDYDLEPGQWSLAQNVRFEDGRVKTFPGNSTFITPVVDPWHILGWPTEAVFKWFYAGLEKIYLYDGTTHTDVTRVSGDYTGTEFNRWSGLVYGGTPVFNNGIDAPQFYNDTTFEDMLWDGANTWTDQNVTTKVMRNFKYHLIALNVTDQGENYPQRFMWSNPAEGGTMPDSWDYSNPANDAGFNDLTQTPGAIVDGLQLRDTFIVYKDDSAYRVSYIGGNNIFSFQRILKVPGMLSSECVVEVKGRHIVLGPGDLYWTDGQSWDSLVDDKVKRTLFDAIDADNMHRCFLRDFPAKDEVWICYPSQGVNFSDSAIVWNYADDTFTFRQLPSGTKDMELGSITSADYTYDDLGDKTYDEWQGTYGARDYSPISYSLVSASGDIQKFEDANLFNGQPARCYAERSGVNLGELGSLQTLTALYPRMDKIGFTVDLYVGGQYQPSDNVEWEGPYKFTPGEQRKIDCRVTGNYHSFRIETNADVAWELSGMDVEHHPAGMR